MEHCLVGYHARTRSVRTTINITIVLVTQLFGPTKMIVSFETEGLGSFTREELEQIVVRDASGRVVQLKLPRKAVLIANHQVMGLLAVLDHPCR